MPRRSHETPAPEPAAETPAEQPATEATVEPTEWKSKAHTDADLRIPADLRTKLGITGHSVWTIRVVEQSEGGFVLSFHKSP